METKTFDTTLSDDPLALTVSIHCPIERQLRASYKNTQFTIAGIDTTSPNVKTSRLEDGVAIFEFLKTGESSAELTVHQHLSADVTISTPRRLVFHVTSLGEFRENLIGALR